MYNMKLFESSSTLAPQASGAGGVIKLLNESSIFPDSRYSSQCGAIYVFAKDHAVLSTTGQVVTSQHWYNIENMRLQPGDGYANDQFAYSMALSGTVLSVGAPGQDGYRDSGGAIYSFHSAFSSLSFAAVCMCLLFVCLCMCAF